MWLPMIQSNLKVSSLFWVIFSSKVTCFFVFFNTAVLFSFIVFFPPSICLRGSSCVSRPSRTGSTTSVCRVSYRRLHSLCENGCSAPSSRWLRWRFNHLRPPHSSTLCDRAGLRSRVGPQTPVCRLRLTSS